MAAREAELGQSLARGIASLYSVQLLTMGLSVVTQLFVGRYLAPADYGSFATAYFLVATLMLVTNAGLMTTLIRQPGELGPGQEASAFAYQLAACLALGAALLAGAPGLGRFFAKGLDPAAAAQEASEIASMIRQLSLMPLLDALLTIPTVRLERGIRYTSLAALSALWAVFERAALIGLILLGMKGHSYVYSRLSTLVLQGLTLGWISGWNPLALLRRTAREGWRGAELLRFGFAIQLKAASVSLVTGINPFVGGKLFASEQVGLVTWAHNMATTVGQPLPQAMGRVILGASARVQGQPDELKRITESCLLLSATFVSLLLAITSATMSEILAHLFNPRWRDAAPLFAISSLVMVEGILLVIYDILVVLLGKPMAAVRANWAWGLASLALCWGLARALGPSGLLWGSVIATALPVLMLVRVVSPHVRIDLWRSFALPVLVSGAVGLAALMAKPHFVTGLWTLVLMDGILLVAGLGLQALSSRRLKDELLKLIRRSPKNP